jgi:DNA repair exonuclease SbcCD ATPase subunit
MENLDIKLSPYAKVKVYWDDVPENYSKEAKNKIRSHFAKKYGFNKNNIDVIYRPIKITENGNIIEINGASIENIMDTNYQRELMKEWIKRENKIVDFNRIINLDEKINAELNIENNDIQHRSWAIRWLMIDNFLSFGEKNYLPFNKLKGLTVVNSLPANQGGKTSLTIDALKFLLHGSTTKTDKNEEIFNSFSDKNELTVRGMIDISDEELIIERRMKRTAKKGGGWTVTNKVNYFKLLPDGEEEQLNDEDAIKTTAKLRNTIGSEKDFEMLVLATEKNLDDLIGLTTTESGKILTRLIGLEVIEMKEVVVRKMYNEFDKKKKSNDYDVVTLMHEIQDHEEKINMGNDAKEKLNISLEEVKKEIEDLNNENDRLLNSKITIDVSIISLNPSKLESEIKEYTSTGLKIKEKVNNINLKIIEFGDIIFNEDRYYDLTKNKNTVTTNILFKKAEVKRLEATIKDLIDGGICKACNRKLDDVDNTEHIETHKKRIHKIEKEIIDLDKELVIIVTELQSLDSIKKNIDEKNKLELERDRGEVEMSGLRNKIYEKNNDLKKYKLNQEAIEHNRRADADVNIVKTKLSVANHSKENLLSKIQTITQDIKNNESEIIIKQKLIKEIKKEEELEKIYKIYIDLVGKKGISKLVLRSVLPIINSELQRLLDDVVDFEVEIFIDDKNDVQFHLNKDGITKLLKSGSGLEKTAASLTLRSILGKLSTLPMPNFITFDEVLGKVANENLEKIKTLFDKIKNMYEIVFLITHNDLIKDWSDNIVTVEKENNISKLTLK